MSATTLSALLPSPVHSAAADGAVTGHREERGEEEHESGPVASSSRSSAIPGYGHRQGWRPRAQQDFANGGAYPECHVAQYPLEMGRGGRKAQQQRTLAVQVDASGKVRYDAIVQQGRREGQIVQSQHKDLVPLREREGEHGKSEMDKPSEEEVAATTERTRLALEKLTQGKIKSAAPRAGALVKQGESTYIRYTPGHQQQQSADGSGKQRIIKMTEQAEDPLAPPRWKFKKIPQGPPSPPAPVLRSPPRKISAQEQKDWMIPPCISNWKNNKGYTIPLDKRLAADGRGLQDVQINDGFAQFSEALNMADRHAREEVRQRAMMQQKLAEKEKAAREEHLRQLAQRAREERSGFGRSSSTAGPASDEDEDDGPSSRIAHASGAGGRSNAANPGGLASAMAGYGSDSDDESDSEDEEAARERDRLREERRRERERDMRMSNMGTEQRARMLAREENRDISEKVALGLAKPTSSADQIDSRLFNQEKLSGTFGDDDSYNMYDKPLFAGAEAAAAMYRRPTGKGGADDIYANSSTAEEAEEAMKNDRFGLGKTKGFQGAEFQQERSGPVQFEKDASDPFSIDQFLDDAKRGTKRAGLEDSSRTKRSRNEASLD